MEQTENNKPWQVYGVQGAFKTLDSSFDTEEEAEMFVENAKKMFANTDWVIENKGFSTEPGAVEENVVPKPTKKGKN